MKRLLFLAAAMLLFTPLCLLAGDATYVTWVSEGLDTVTVDSQWTGNWDPVDSIVVAPDDSGYVVLTVSAWATLGPYDMLYLGLGNDSANRVSAATAATTGQTYSNLDTATFWGSGYRGRPARVYVELKHYVKYTASTTDTIYVNCASGGSGQKIRLEDLVVHAEIADLSP